MHSKKIFRSLALAVLLPLAGRAAPLLLNGSFEGGITAPWYTNAGVSITTIGYGSATDVDGPGTAFGLVAFTQAYFSGGAGSLFQDFSLSEAGRFDYSFFLSRSELTSSSNDVPLTFDLLVDGVVLDHTLPGWGFASGIHPDQVSVWTPYAGFVDLGAGSHVFEMHFSRGDSGFGRAVVFTLDEVVTGFTPAGGSTAPSVPDSGSTVVLAGLGLVTLAGLRRTGLIGA